MSNEYCIECGCKGHPVTEERVPLKRRITKSKLWLGHHYDLYNDDDIKFGFTFAIMSVVAIISAITSSEYLFGEPKDYNLQLGIFLALISTILFCILLSMVIYNQGLRIVLKVIIILISGVILLGSVLFGLFYLSEIITERIE